MRVAFAIRPVQVLLMVLGLGGVFAAINLENRGVSSAGDSSNQVGKLIAIKGMQTARAVHTATLLHDGTVLIAGGFTKDRESDPFASAERYDPARNVFTSAGSMQTARQSHTATLLNDGRVLITGGYDGSHLDSAELFDPAHGVFVATGRMGTGRIGHRATRLQDGKVLITGGARAGMELVAQAEVYDPETGQFTPVGALKTPRIGHTQTVLADGTVLILGGSAGRRGSRQVQASAELFDPFTGTFREVGALRVARHKHAAVLMEDERVLVIGGSNERDSRGRYDSVEIYEPATHAFITTGSLKTSRFKLRTAATLLTNGKVLVAGGAPSVEVYDPETGDFSTVPGGLGAPWFFSTTVVLQDGRVLIAGGYDQRIESTANAWIYEP